MPPGGGSPATILGASFEYLAANVLVDMPPGGGSPATIFPPYSIKQIGGATIAFIGMTLKGTPQIVLPSGTVGLSFEDEVNTANALVPQLKSQGASTPSSFSSTKVAHRTGRTTNAAT